MRNERWSDWSINFGGVCWERTSVRCRAGRGMHGLNCAETRHFQARTYRGMLHQRLRGVHRLILVLLRYYTVEFVPLLGTRVRQSSAP